MIYTVKRSTFELHDFFWYNITVRFDKILVIQHLYSFVLCHNYKKNAYAYSLSTKKLKTYLYLRFSLQKDDIGYIDYSISTKQQ